MGHVDHGDMLLVLQSELRLRNVDVPDSLLTRWPPFDWTIHRDEFGLTITFPSEQVAPVGAFVAKIFGIAKFSCEHGPTMIYRDDVAWVTVMLTATDGAGQLILLHWQESAIRLRMAELQLAAITENSDGAVRDAIGAVAQAIDSADTVVEDTKWAKATAALDDARETLNAFLADGAAPQLPP